MNENTTADTSVNATAIDDETLSRAVLTYCLDSADAMMYALVKGVGSARIPCNCLPTAVRAIMKAWPRQPIKPWTRRSSTALHVGDAPSMLEVWPPSTAQWSRGSIA